MSVGLESRRWAARRACHGLERAVPAEQVRIVQLPVERVEVQKGAIKVWMRAEGPTSLVGELPAGRAQSHMTRSIEIRLVISHLIRGRTPCPSPGTRLALPGRGQ
jgi:hypothetical protein